MPLVERPDQDDLDERAQHGAAGEPDRRRHEEAQRTEPIASSLRSLTPGRVGADRDEGAVREVQHAHQAVDQRQAGGDQEVHGAEPEPGDREQDEGVHQ